MICLVCASSVTSANPDQSLAEKHSLRVMTYNVLYGGKPLSQTAKVIQASGADIVGLQEIGPSVKDLAALLGCMLDGPSDEIQKIQQKG